MTANSSGDAIVRHADGAPIVRHADGSIDIAFYARRASRLRGLAIAEAEDRCIAGAGSMAGRVASLIHRYLAAAAGVSAR